MSKIVVGEIEGPSTTSNKITIASGSQLDIAGSPGGSGAINLAVDGSDITTGTVTAPRLPVGTIINSEMFTNNTRTALSAASGTAFWSVSYTKKLADSVLFVIANVRGWDDASGASGSYVEIDGTKYYSAGYSFNGQSYIHSWFGTASKQVSTSGAKTISLGWLTADGGVARPFMVWNYNSTDDSRCQQAVSTIQVMEVTV
jgi:hypothetical protein